MDTCTVESGLFRNKPCGKAAVTRCVNCEQPLCVQHAVAKKAPSAPAPPRKPAAPASGKPASPEGKNGGIDFTPRKDKN